MIFHVYCLSPAKPWRCGKIGPTASDGPGSPAASQIPRPRSTLMMRRKRMAEMVDQSSITPTTKLSWKKSGTNQTWAISLWMNTLRKLFSTAFLWWEINYFFFILIMIKSCGYLVILHWRMEILLFLFSCSSLPVPSLPPKIEILRMK